MQRIRQQTASGLSAGVNERKVLTDDFFKTSATDDWSTVRVAANANEQSSTWLWQRPR